MPATALSIAPTRGARPFLGVERSVAGRPWRDRLDERAAARALAIVQRHGVPELLARILAGRGVEVDAVEAFLDPSIRRLMPDPSVVTGMAAAAARLADAITRTERIAIFGDYDVDGATSAALLARFLRHGGLDPEVYIPDRLFEGYGPNVEAIRALAGRGARLLVTVDCGTTSVDALAEAQRLGLDTIVIDHHQADAQLPPALAVVNPNRLDDLSGLGYLAAAGLVFLVLVAVNRTLRERGFWTAARPEPDLLGLLDLVALGTVADVSRLEGLNRAFVAKGLIAMRRRERIGLTALMDVARLSGPPEPWHLGFLLGPRINAGGRIGRADLGTRLLLTEDLGEAATIAADLDRLNRERQELEIATLAAAEAEASAALGSEERGAVVVTAAAGWHPGIVGLVAARLKERFGRPAFAIALEPGGTGTGSGRSISGVDLGRAVRRAVAENLLIKGGGHAMAAGVTVRHDRLAPFRAFLETELAAAVEAARRDRALLIDGAVTAAAAGPEFHAMVARAGPYGPGNPEPVFALPSHVIAYAEEVGQAHVRVRLKSGDGTALSAIAFRAAGQPLGHALLKNRGRAVHAAGTLALDHWQGEERVQLRLIDLAADDPVGRA
jgi:single-stranded-DNA-specific exonuclease